MLGRRVRYREIHGWSTGVVFPVTSVDSCIVRIAGPPRALVPCWNMPYIASDDRFAISVTLSIVVGLYLVDVSH